MILYSSPSRIIVIGCEDEQHVRRAVLPRGFEQVHARFAQASQESAQEGASKSRGADFDDEEINQRKGLATRIRVWDAQDAPEAPAERLARAGQGRVCLVR